MNAQLRGGQGVDQPAQAGGLGRMREVKSDVDEYGVDSRGPRMVDARAREEMRRILGEIRSGEFAREFAEAVHRVHRVMAELDGAESTVHALETALNLTGTDELAEAFGETSNAQAALGVAVNSILRHPVDFERAVGAAASIAGDRPATAALCGALFGASAGVDGIPSRRLNALAVRGVADRLIKDATTRFGDPAPPSSAEWLERYNHLMGAEGGQR